MYEKGGDRMDQKSVDKMFSALSPQQQQYIREILSDKNKTQQILSSPQAQAIMKKLSEDKKNG